MRISRDSVSVAREIESSPDPLVSRLLSARVRFNEEYADEEDSEWLLSVIVVEPGDTLRELDAEMDGQLLANVFARTVHGDPRFKPPCETLEEYAGFYELLFILSDAGHGLSMIVPKTEGINGDLLAMCRRWATPAQEIPE